tara:strand:- start:616 stop:792 length:177 start_codon:yes stop_codon:yes gene_type:complete
MVAVLKKIRGFKFKELIEQAKTNPKARFWLRIFIAYHIVKGTLTTAFIWAPMAYFYVF